MGMGAEAGRWGVQLRGLELSRWEGRGGSVLSRLIGRSEPSFRLAADRLDIVAGAPALNRVPIMGESGLGKSTLLNALSGVAWTRSRGTEVTWRFPDGATLRWGGWGPRGRDMRALRRRYFGYAFQSPRLAEHLTVGQNLTFGLIADGLSLDDADKRAAHRLARVFPDRDAKALMRRTVTTLSGGERQRVALVQAMVHDPYVLFADEPTGSLDPKNRSRVMRVMLDWLDEAPTRRLLVWVTHHENDPQDNGAARRIFIDETGCCWQRLESGSLGGADGWRPEALEQAA